MNFCKKFYIFFLYLVSIGFNTTICAHVQDFIIKPVKTKKLSINVLKENIGQATKGLFQTTTRMNKNLASLHVDIAQAQTIFTRAHHHALAPTVLEQATKITKTFGMLQSEVASLQNKFSDIIEQLVENQAPFKKASRADLEGALHIIQTVDKEFEHNSAMCNNMRAALSGKTSEKKVDKKTGEPLGIDTTLVINQLKDIEKKLEHHVTVVKNAYLTMTKNVCLK